MGKTSEQWRIELGGNFVDIMDHRDHKMCCVDCDDEPTEEEIKRATSIAALPDLIKALKDICSRAPVTEPERYSGDNHGDTEDNAMCRQHYWLAQKARTALAKAGIEAV